MKINFIQQTLCLIITNLQGCIDPTLQTTALEQANISMIHNANKCELSITIHSYYKLNIQILPNEYVIYNRKQIQFCSIKSTVHQMILIINSHIAFHFLVYKARVPISKSMLMPISHIFLSTATPASATDNTMSCRILVLQAMGITLAVQNPWHVLIQLPLALLEEKPIAIGFRKGEYAGIFWILQLSPISAMQCTPRPTGLGFRIQLGSASLSLRNSGFASSRV